MTTVDNPIREGRHRSRGVASAGVVRGLGAGLAAVLVLVLAAPASAAQTAVNDGLVVSPAVGQFGRVEIGSCNPETDEGCKVIYFTLRNVGRQPIYFGGFGIQEPTEDFGFASAFIQDDCGLLPLVQVNGTNYLSLAPGASCRLGVLFTPRSEGRIERTWTGFFDNQFEPIFVMPLRGFGVA